MLVELNRGDRHAVPAFAAPGRPAVIAALEIMKDKPIDRNEQDRLLDEALGETFPASDPVSMQQNCIVGAVSGGRKTATKTKRPGALRTARGLLVSAPDGDPGSTTER